MAAFLFSLILSLFSFALRSIAGDPDMLQDICVADLKSEIKLNGYPCKHTAEVTAVDFFSDALARPGSTNNSMGSKVTRANVQQIPGLNTLGVSLARVDYAPDGGLNPPHVHPRASEVVFVLRGALEVGFVTTNGTLFRKKIRKGESFVFPKGLAHFQMNVGRSHASAIAAFSSQLPGTQQVAPALFAATPPVPDAVLAKAFQIDTKEVEKIKSRFANIS